MFEHCKKVLIPATEGFTGAEIEKAIKDAIAASFYQDKKDLTSQNLLAAIADTKPISQVMSNKVKKLRDRAKGSFRFASSSTSETSSKQNKSNKTIKSSRKKLNLDEAVSDIEVFSKKNKQNSKPTGKPIDNRFLDI